MMIQAVWTGAENDIGAILQQDASDREGTSKGDQ
jgi:hypothetical protein